MKDMGSIGVDFNAIDIFCIDIAANMVTLLNNKKMTAIL